MRAVNDHGSRDASRVIAPLWQALAHSPQNVQAAKANQTIPIVGTVTPGFPYHDFIEPRVESLNPHRDWFRDDPAEQARFFALLRPTG